MRWIGLSGPMGAGKDYAYQRMLELDRKVMRVSFADQLRQEMMEELGMTEFPAKPYSEAVRKVQQWWGTDYRRAEDPDYWVKKAEQQAVRVAGMGYIPVFTDVRFPNEAAMIRSYGGLLVRVVAPTKIREKRLGGVAPNHESENAMMQYPHDFILGSDGINRGRYEQKLRDILGAAHGS